MFSESDIIGKSWMVVEITNAILKKDSLVVHKIFLIGSYADNSANDWSDIDYLIELKGNKQVGRIYPSWQQIQEIHDKLSKRIHVIFGTEEAQIKLHKPYREIRNLPKPSPTTQTTV